MYRHITKYRNSSVKYLVIPPKRWWKSLVHSKLQIPGQLWWTCVVGPMWHKMIIWVGHQKRTKRRTWWHHSLMLFRPGIMRWQIEDFQVPISTHISKYHTSYKIFTKINIASTLGLLMGGATIPRLFGQILISLVVGWSTMRSVLNSFKIKSNTSLLFRLRMVGLTSLWSVTMLLVVTITVLWCTKMDLDVATVQQGLDVMQPMMLCVDKSMN